jgi:hypothetical protein
MTRWILALVFAALSVPGSSAAGVLTIDFSLRGSAMAQGSVTLSLTGVDASGLSTDPTSTAMLVDFRLGFTESAGPLPMVGGPLQADFLQRGAAMLIPSGDGFFDLPLGDLQGTVTIFGFGGPPFRALFSNAGDPPTRFSVSGLAGGATLSSNGLLPLAFDELTVRFQIDGVEVRRRFVPEPAAPGLWALALAALALAPLGYRSRPSRSRRFRSAS